ncbi:MAG TPA: PBP1A family penicillin-binding protein [Acidimicrobiales bacterium]|nr:PBP1A family penicillin-binding protein [Acidimicrobiales bacterium]
MRPLVRFVVTLVLAGATLALGVALLVPQVGALTRAGRPGKAADVNKLAEVSQNSTVYARDGSLIAVLHAEENRSPVSLDRVPKALMDAVLDVEDEEFWAHQGLNVRSTVRALLTNVQSGEVRQGGSTITQQLVKNSLLTPEQRVDRKIREAVLAVRLEKEISKEDILERYLNVVYFGNGAYGVQAAAETYFNTDVEKLNEGQAALLAGVIRNPVGYDPVKNPVQAGARRDLVLDRMVVNGHLGAEAAARLKTAPVPVKVFTPLPPPDDYFVEEVKQRLLADERLGETGQERYNAVFKGGLQIYTTLDPKQQRQAEQRRNEVLSPTVTKGRFTSSLVAVEPSTGYVRAMVAGDDFGTAKYNLATQGTRQPGSSFKPYVLLAALEAGYSPNDIVDGSSPCTIKVRGFQPYSPGNYEGSTGGRMSITDATARSVNCAYARLGVDVGLDKVVDMAVRLGLPKKRLEPYPSISLGAEEATPLEMASAYAAMANDGYYREPRFVEKVLDRNNKVVFEGPDKGRRAVSVQTARVATSVLQTVVERGTGTRARVPGRQVAGKTGTSQEYENAWFVGFTPQLATAVWMGSTEGNVPMTNVGGIRVTGGSYPARIWSAFMGDALADRPAVPFPLPDPVRTGRSLGGRSSRYQEGDGGSSDDRRTYERDSGRAAEDRRGRRPSARRSTRPSVPPPEPDPEPEEETELPDIVYEPVP